MRGFLKFLGILAFLYCLYFLHHYYDVSRVKKDSVGFVTSVTNAAASSWNVTEFMKNADPNSRGMSTIGKAFDSYRRLGKPAAEIQCEIQDTDSYHYPGTGVLYVSATYQCDGQFEKGAATIFVTLNRTTNKGGWKIMSFDVYSPSLSAPAPKASAPAETKH